MLLAEEVTLLLLGDHQGTWLVDKAKVCRAVQAAYVVELMARQALVVDERGKLAPGIPGVTGGDRDLDRMVLALQGRTLKRLRLMPRSELRRLLARLRDAGVLRQAPVRRYRYLPANEHPEAQVRGRMREVLTSDLRPDLHTALLVAIVHELNLVEFLFDSLPPEANRRAREIVAQLRSDSTYFPDDLATTRSAAQRTSDAMDDVMVIGDAVEGLVAVGRLASLPVRVVFRLLDGI